VITKNFLSDCWKLAGPFWNSKERGKARFLLAVIVTLNLGEVYINVLLNQWNNDFYNSLQTSNKEAFVEALFRFSYLAFTFILVAVYKIYLNQMLRLKWRRWMTAQWLDRWLEKKNYYRIPLIGAKADNPDQRISEDIEQFIQLSLGLSLGLLSSVVTLFSFLTILWTLSGALNFSFLGIDISIPGYMVWAALLYAIAGTWVTMRIGRPLIRLNYDQQRFEADFRFGMVRLRENSESIAFYRGEAREHDGLMDRFSSVMDNFWKIMKRQKTITWFTASYQQIAVIFPYVVASPRFFAGQIQLGGLMQTASAFGQVQGALSYIIEIYTSFATMSAVVERLIGFEGAIEQSEEAAKTPASLDFTQNGDVLMASNLTLRLPEGQILLKNIDITVKPGDSLLITGPSGRGKSTLLRALAGLWPFMEGKLALPSRELMFFVPQKPYLPLGTLRVALSYPGQVLWDDATLKDALTQCQLPHLTDRLDEVAPWSNILSLGEQQRLAFARVLLARPAFLFMDEATSALDKPTETKLYEMVKKEIPGLALVSVGHHEGLKLFHSIEKQL